MATYTVKSGDNPFKIANLFGVPTDVILNTNPGLKVFKPGVVIKIPSVKPAKKSTYGPPAPYGPPKPTLPPSLSQANRVTQSATAGVNRAAIPAIYQGAGTQRFATGPYGEETVRKAQEVFSQINPNQRPPMLISEIYVNTMKAIAGTQKTIDYMATTGYRQNPITGNWVYLASAAPYKPVASAVGSTPQIQAANVASANMSSSTTPSGGWRGNWAGGIDTGFVGSTSAMGGLAQAGPDQGQALKGANSGWVTRAKKRKKQINNPPTSTSPKQNTNYNNGNYMSYGTGLIHWRV